MTKPGDVPSAIRVKFSRFWFASKYRISLAVGQETNFKVNQENGLRVYGFMTEEIPIISKKLVSLTVKWPKLAILASPETVAAFEKVLSKIPALATEASARTLLSGAEDLVIVKTDGYDFVFHRDFLRQKLSEVVGGEKRDEKYGLISVRVINNEGLWPANLSYHKVKYSIA